MLQDKFKNKFTNADIILRKCSQSGEQDMNDKFG